jgi:hypothetical protein
MTLKSIKKYAMQTQISSNLLKEVESTQTPAEFLRFEPKTAAIQCAPPVSNHISQSQIWSGLFMISPQTASA